MKKTIGIIGGMGPAATADLFQLIVENTDAACDQEHIHVLIDSNPMIPDRTAAIIYGTESPFPELCRSAERLVNAGADFLIIPCNTSHYFLDEIKKAVSVPILDMIKETAIHVRNQGFREAIILCTEGTRKTGVYTKRFQEQGIKAIYPDDALQREVNGIVYDGIKKGLAHYDAARFNSLLEDLTNRTGAAVVLGCTELPIAQRKYQLRGNFINPSWILACAAIREAGCAVKTPQCAI